MAGGSGSPEEADNSQSKEMIEQADMDDFLVSARESRRRMGSQESARQKIDLLRKR